MKQRGSMCTSFSHTLYHTPNFSLLSLRTMNTSARWPTTFHRYPIYPVTIRRSAPSSCRSRQLHWHRARLSRLYSLHFTLYSRVSPAPRLKLILYSHVDLLYRKGHTYQELHNTQIYWDLRERILNDWNYFEVELDPARGQTEAEDWMHVIVCN